MINRDPSPGFTPEARRRFELAAIEELRRLIAPGSPKGLENFTARRVTTIDLEGEYPTTQAVMTYVEGDGTQGVFRFPLWEEEEINVDDPEEVRELAHLMAINVAGL